MMEPLKPASSKSPHLSKNEKQVKRKVFLIHNYNK